MRNTDGLLLFLCVCVCVSNNNNTIQCVSLFQNTVNGFVVISIITGVNKGPTLNPGMVWG